MRWMHNGAKQKYKAMPKHISKAQGQKLYAFNDLNADAQKVAMSDFLQVESDAVKRLMSEHRNTRGNGII